MLYLLGWFCSSVEIQGISVPLFRQLKNSDSIGSYIDYLATNIKTGLQLALGNSEFIRI